MSTDQTTGSNFPEPSDPNRFRLNPRQQELRRYLERKQKGLGDIYFGALYALNQSDNPESLVQAAHSFRELTRILRTVFPGLPVDHSRSNAFNKVKELSAFYKSGPSDQQLRQYVADLSAFYDDAVVDRSQRFIQFLEAAGAGASASDYKERAAKALLEAENWLSGLAHHGNLSDELESGLRKRFDSVEQILEALLAEYYSVEKQLTRLMGQPQPSEAEMQLLASILIRPSLHDHFFKNLEQVGWLVPLYNAGYFKKPVDILRHDTDSISCPSWPQHRFLLRCAPIDSELVVKILLEVEDTENSRCHQELVEVALLLPASLLQKFSERASKWIRDIYQTISLLPSRLADLAAKLAKEDQAEWTLSMARVILDVHIDEVKFNRHKESMGEYATAEACPWQEEWHYKEALVKIQEAIPAEYQDELLRILCKKLQKIIRLESTYGKPEGTEPVDYTHIVRPAIEDHEQNTRTSELKDHLIEHIRDLAIVVVNSTENLSSVISILRSFALPTFRRIELHLICAFPGYAQAMIETWLTDEAAFDDPTLVHEFHRFLKTCFGKADKRAQRKYLDWVRRGLDLDERRKFYNERTGEELSEEVARAQLVQWKVNKYAAVVDFLDGDDLAEFQKLREVVEPEDHPEFGHYSFSWTGPTSPKGPEELSTMSVREVLEYLKSWNPPVGHYQATPEGLGRFVRQDVSSRALEYSRLVQSIDLSCVRPVYLYHIFAGFREAIKNGRDLDWNPILQLSINVVAGPVLPEPGGSADEYETGWTGARREIAGLLEEALKKTGIIDFKYRDLVWSIIEPLTREEEPTLEYEEQYGGANMSPTELSINTARGDAVHAFFRYIAWVDRNLNALVSEERQSHCIPAETIQTLERLVNVAEEPTLTIRSVVGWYIQTLAYLDLEWTKTNLHKLIPPRGESNELRDAFFEGYFSFNRPAGFLFRNLRELFVEAFEWADSSSERTRSNRARLNYADHLITHCWWGLDRLEEPESLIRRLLENGGLELRTHVLESIGRSFHEFEVSDDTNGVALKRLRDVLDFSLSMVAKIHPPSDEIAKEFSVFGWWFSSAHSEPEWHLAKLEEITVLTSGQLEWAHKVVERLPEFVTIDAVKVATIVDRLVRNSRTIWEFDFRQDQLRQVLLAIRGSGSDEAWSIARRTINYLGDQGIRNFGDLLD